MNPSYYHSTYNCHYCAAPFDPTTRAPYLICPNQHQICLQCLTDLRSPANCRVCQRPIQFNRIKLNQQLVNTITQNKLQSQLSVHDNNRPLYPRLSDVQSHKKPKVGSYSAYNDLNPMNDNFQNQNQVYTPTYNHQAAEHAHPHSLHDDQHCSGIKCCCNIPMNQKDRQYGLGIFIFQLIFSIINLIIALASQPSQCMDRKFRVSYYGLRNCLMFTFYYDLALIGLLLMGAVLVCLRCMKNESFKSLTNLVYILSIVKLVAWAIIQIELWHLGNSQDCTGGLYAYGIIMLIIHYPLIVVGVIAVFIMSGCRC